MHGQYKRRGEEPKSIQPQLNLRRALPQWTSKGGKDDVLGDGGGRTRNSGRGGTDGHLAIRLAPTISHLTWLGSKMFTALKWLPLHLNLTAVKV